MVISRAVISMTSSSGLFSSVPKHSMSRFISIRPNLPKPVIEASYGGFAPIVTDMLAGAGWGWHIETAIHVIRIILGGTFDRLSETAARGRPHGRDASFHVATT